MRQPLLLWGLPQISSLPPERRRPVRTNFRRLNFRSWQQWAAVSLMIVPALAAWLFEAHLRPWVESLQSPPAGIGPLIVRLAVFFLVGIFPILLPIPSMRRNYRLAMRENGFCPCCGYDLRATPDRCPECGAVPVKGATA